MTQAIRFDRLSFSYTGNPEHNVLNEVSLSLEPGRVSVITGPSGCGKSTLLYLAAGLYPEHSGVITHGTCTLGDRDITAMPAEERSRAIRMVFQNPELQFCFDLVRQEMIFVMENAGIDPDEMMARMDEALQLVGLGGYADRSIRTLSGGEKQRLNLAAQWMIGTQWLLLDEIFTQIDPPAIHTILPILKRMNREHGVSIVAVDHHLGLWQDLVDDIFVMAQGGTLIATPDDVRAYTPAQWEALGVMTHATRFYPVPPPPDASQTLVEAHNLTIQRGSTTVLTDAHFTIPSGQIIALLGPSGTGKTSLLYALAGFIAHQGELTGPVAPRFKKVSWLRRLWHRIIGVTGLTPESGRARMLFQNPQEQFVTNKVSDELLFTLQRRYPDAPDKQEALARQALKDAKLWTSRRFPPFQLSEGQQRRLAVMTLLLEDAELLLCDEPCYAQDLNNLRVIMGYLVDAARQRGAAVLFTTHDPAIAEHYADQIWSLEGGRLSCRTT